MVDNKSKKSKSSGIKINNTCPNMPKRKATGWSKLLVDGKPMLVKTCCRGCAVAIEKKIKDGKMKKEGLVLVPLNDAKKLVSAGEKIRDVKVGGVAAGCCGDRSSKRKSRKGPTKKRKGCGCSGNKRRTHKAQKGGAVRAGTVVQNMPVRQKGGAVRAGTVVQNMPVRLVNGGGEEKELIPSKKYCYTGELEDWEDYNPIIYKNGDTSWKRCPNIKASDYYCKTGILENGEDYHQLKHLYGDTPYQRCPDRYKKSFFGFTRKNKNK